MSSAKMVAILSGERSVKQTHPQLKHLSGLKGWISWYSKWTVQKNQLHPINFEVMSSPSVQLKAHETVIYYMK